MKQYTPYSIAVLLTCHNRKAKTSECLRRLLAVADDRNDIRLSIFLTDDGCTDGTADAVRNICCDRELHIVNGNGHLYWAGGMLVAWQEAMKQHERWHFYLLLNDDTTVMSNVFDELLNAHHYALNTYGKAGIYSGVTCDPDDTSVITYGGNLFKSAAQAKSERKRPQNVPQLVDTTNANILLVPRDVVDIIGIFPDCYQHSCSDYDYCMTARRHGIPALITANVCGKCKDDHPTNEQECLALMKMSYTQRKRYINTPTHSDKDYLTFVRRNSPRKYPVSWVMRKLRLYTPKLYYHINKARGLYN